MTAVKDMQQADVARLAALPDISAFALEDDYFARCYQLQCAGRRQVFLAWAEDDIAGFVLLNFVPRYSPFQRLGIAEIQDLNVRPHYRRQGIGTALIAHCEEKARARGDEMIGIAVGLHAGYGAAQRLYGARGYLPDGQGVTCDRAPISPQQRYAIDDDLCLMLIKEL